MTWEYQLAPHGIMIETIYDFGGPQRHRSLDLRSGESGLKAGVVTRKGFEGRFRELVTGHITLERIAGAMLSARAPLKVEYEKPHKTVLTIVREDAVCRRLMTVPSVGPLVAITYKSAGRSQSHR